MVLADVVDKKGVLKLDRTKLRELMNRILLQIPKN